MKIIYLFSTLVVSSVVAEKSLEKYTSLPYTSYGELNSPCRSSRDCKPFGYFCRDDRSCQCTQWYVPDRDMKKCLGGVNQKCTYDEHCVEGAYCMNQSICQCKEDTPYASEDGLYCSSSRNISPAFLVQMASLLVIAALRI